MVLRRIRDDAATQNWFGVAIDVVIVFIGVFLGIQANNWNEARIAETAARADRSRLIEDLRTNELDFEGRRLYYEDVRQHGLKALEGFSSPSADLGEDFLVAAYQASQVRLRPMRRFTYDELVATGDLGGIGDQAVREKLAVYYLGLTAMNASIGDIPPYRDRIRREMPYSVQDRIRSQCGEQSHQVKGAVIRRLPADCRTGLEMAMVASAVAQLRAAPEMDRDLTRYITDIDQKINAFDGAQRRARELRQELVRSPD
ncbi:MAG TPA: hypothetical protein VFR60_04115 [Sphingomicrobium sp.]|nr:hypothetical protein [Sphingomicrobium sp.]